MLAALGAFAGIALSYVLLRVVLATTDAPRWISPTPDWRVLLFSGGIMLVAALFFGLAPALQIARRRTKEIAIRMALGATKTRLCTALLKQFTWPVLAGLGAGTLLTVFVSRFLRIALFGVSNLDPIGYAAGLGVLLGVVVLAGILPARKAMRLNVARALHYE